MICGFEYFRRRRTCQRGHDIHTQIIQTSFARTLGLRLDPGLGILGAIGQWDYRLWLSNGNGPDMMDDDANKVITARIAPRSLVGDADVWLGLSGLAGSLPYWSLDSLASMGASLIATGCSGCLLQFMDGIHQRGMKTRVLHIVEALDEACAE